MVNENKNITKVCGFYMSDWHLITMLLPNINKLINKGNEITTILEEDAKEKIEILLSKIKIENANKITSINWRKRNIENIKPEELEIGKKENAEKTIIIVGSEEYIAKANCLVEGYIKEKENVNLKIINCYSAQKKLNIKEILDNHKTVLNTAGERTTKEFMKSINMVK